MKALVTGGAGFIGSHLVRALIEQGAAVTVYDNLSQGCEANLRDVTGSKNLELVTGDILDLPGLERAMQGKTRVFHLAAMNSIPRSIDFPLESHACNITGTLNVLMAARRNNVQRVIYSSSSSVYGNQPTSFRTETMVPNPIAPYPLQKLVGEHYARQFWGLYSLETVSLRYFNVFGPGQPVNSPYSAVIPKFIAALQSGKAPVIFGDGSQARDFTYVDNVVQANLLAARVDAKEICGLSFNIAAGESITLNELLTELKLLIGSEITPKFEASRQGDVRATKADISLARKFLNYDPKVSWKQGLRPTLDYYSNSRMDSAT
jgi:nucleoside-diphosphate-sugar epimerase